MKIRKILTTDFEEILDLWIMSGLRIVDNVREKKEFEKLIDLNPDLCLVILEKDKIIASVMGAFNGKRGWVYHLAVHPEHQKKGYGSILINKLESLMKNKGATKIQLFVAKHNIKVVPFYEKFGFSIVKDAFVMKKDLWSGGIKDELSV